MSQKYVFVYGKVYCPSDSFSGWIASIDCLHSDNTITKDWMTCGGKTKKKATALRSKMIADLRAKYA